MSRIVLIILSILFLAVPAFPVTFQWDWPYGCNDVIGFRLYYGETSGNTTFKMIEVPCTETAITFDTSIQGFFVAKSYNNTQESESSNEVLLAAYYYNSILYDYTPAGVLLYKGEHTSHNASQSDSNWVITKYYYSAQGRINQVRIRTTSWTNRAIGW